MQDQIDDVLNQFQHHNHEQADLLVQRREILCREYDRDIENDPIELEAIHERQQLLWFGLSKSQKQELCVAFRIVSRGKEAISGSKVFDLMQAIGITLLPEQIQSLLANSLKDKNGQYNYPNLETAINKYVANMIQVRILRGIYEALKQNGELPTNAADIDSFEMKRLQRTTAIRLKSSAYEYQNEGSSISKSCCDVLKGIFSNVIASSSASAQANVDGISTEQLSQFLNGIMNTVNEEDQISKEDVNNVIAEISSRRNDQISLFEFINLFRAG